MDLTAYVDFKVAIILWVLGAGIKHLKVLDKVANELIPPILMFAGVALSIFVAGTFNIDILITGVCTGAFAIGTHKSGQELFRFSGLMGPSKSKNEKDTEG